MGIVIAIIAAAAAVVVVVLEALATTTTTARITITITSKRAIIISRDIITRAKVQGKCIHAVLHLSLSSIIQWLMQGSLSLVFFVTLFRDSPKSR